MNFSIMGAIIVALVAIPSLSLLIFKPQHAPVEKQELPLILSVLEHAGRIGCVVAILFSNQVFGHFNVNIWLVFVYFFLLLYYICWLRYLYGGRTHYLLFKPLFHIPVPMAIFPSLLFLCAGLWNDSLLLTFMALLFSVGHITNSYLIYKRNYS